MVAIRVRVRSRWCCKTLGETHHDNRKVIENLRDLTCSVYPYDSVQHLIFCLQYAFQSSKSSGFALEWGGVYLIDC